MEDLSGKIKVVINIHQKCCGRKTSGWVRVGMGAESLFYIMLCHPATHFITFLWVHNSYRFMHWLSSLCYQPEDKPKLQ